MKFKLVRETSRVARMDEIRNA